ncbi:hypothetical protein [Usitatibacter palustris]|uniref:Uncharacterized protein n=1 Tax=Usitatibacter palustris TaxID=2732487 RepID=A0A6M4HA69_9PROT|nr:hypothetical protein [Usitatibacter palustris]QJR16689.1 hypothetical protein DSM104440_03525 [Usitatibacter palustris]
MRISFPRTASLIFLIATAFPALSQESLSGSQLAPPALLKGPLHKVAEPVRVEGYLGKFEIESSVGKFSVRGVNMLGVRVQELGAIAELQKVQKQDAFQGALAKSAGGIAKFAGDAVDDPNKTVENIGSGVGTVFGRVGYMAKSGANYVGDKAVDKVTGNSTAANTSATGEPEPPSFTGDPLGYNSARREWAKKLNVDPYTSNPVLRQLLDKAASASFAGNFAVSLTLGAVVGPLQYAYTFDETVRDSVWNKPALDLEKENQAKLVALGVADRTVRDLLRNRWFTPSLQTALTARLGALGKIPGVESVVATAAKVQGETRARFLLESLAMLTDHAKGTKLASLRMSNLVPVGVAADGSAVAAVAVDYVTWDTDAIAFASRKELGAKGKTLLVAGKVSDAAGKELKKAGWTVKAGLRS